MDSNVIRNLITNDNVYNLRDVTTTNNIKPFIQAPNNVTDNDKYIMTESHFLTSFNSKMFPSEETTEAKLTGINHFSRGTILITNENIMNAIHLYRYVNVLYEQMKNICRAGATLKNLKPSSCGRAQEALGRVMGDLSAFIRMKYSYGGKKNSKTKHKSHRKNRLSKSHSRRRSYSRKLKR